MKKKWMISLMAIFSIASCLKAQVPSLNPVNGVLPAVMNISGGMYDNASSYYRFEWSMGEAAVIQAFAPPDSSILITHGVLQPCTDKIGLAAYTTAFEAGDYKLFPNPTAGRFEVDFFVNMPGQMSLQLINSLGQVLEKKTFPYDGCCRIEIFDLTNRPSGVYFVIAELKPLIPRHDGVFVIRHSGFKVIKVNNR